MNHPQRKPNRLSYYDYSSPGAYFITICTQNKLPILCSIAGGSVLDAPHIQLSQTGRVVQKYIESGNKMPGITVDKYVIMPNHIHLILIVDKTAQYRISKKPSPANAAIPHFISTLKRFCHRDIGQSVFQRSYHDHVIRNEKDYLQIWEYTDNNPAKWQEDCFYVPSSQSANEGVL